MENAETILVIILSSFLAIFLLLAIILAIKCIQIADQIKLITLKAEQFVDKAESVGEFFKKSSSSFAAARLIAHIADSVFKRDESSSRKKR